MRRNRIGGAQIVVIDDKACTGSLPDSSDCAVNDASGKTIEMTMDKKAKKRIVVLRTRLQKLQKMLAGAKQQCDDPSEIPELEQQITKIEEELATLTGKPAKSA